MLLWKLLPFSRRVAIVYMLAICLLLILHFMVADDFTYNHVKHYSAIRCRFGCFNEFLSTYQLFNSYPRLGLLNKLRDTQESSDDNTRSPTKISSSDTENREIAERNESNKMTSDREIDNDYNDKEQLFKPPRGEVPTRRYPQCVIIGFTKGGTRALIEFMALHPYIRVARNEVHYYDKDEIFEKGYDWYKQQMPLTYSNQITVEKTPAYILTQRARDEMFEISPYVKLIALVRDPVIRLVSQYLLKYRFSDKMPPLTVVYTNTTTGLFDPEMRPVDIGNYQKHINMWLQRFPFRQLLILNSEDLTGNPLNVMKKVERFLKIPPLFSERNVYYNTTSGFNCPRGFEPKSPPRCLGKTKGLVHPKLSPEDERMLYDYYKPYNEKLFKLLGYRINWTERKWGKEE